MHLSYYNAFFLCLIFNYSYSQTSTKNMKKQNQTSTNNNKLLQNEFMTYTHLNANDSTNLLKDITDRINGDWFFDDDLFGKLEVSIKLSNKTYDGSTTFYFDSKPQPSLHSKLQLIDGHIKIVTTVSADESDIADIKVEGDSLTIKNATNTTVFKRQKK